MLIICICRRYIIFNLFLNGTFGNVFSLFKIIKSSSPGRLGLISNIGSLIYYYVLYIYLFWPYQLGTQTFLYLNITMLNYNFDFKHLYSLLLWPDVLMGVVCSVMQTRYPDFSVPKFNYNKS